MDDAGAPTTTQGDMVSSSTGAASSASSGSEPVGSDTTAFVDTSTGTPASTGGTESSSGDGTTGAAPADVLALRIVALGVRDPHFFLDGCPPGETDATANLNDSIAASLASDGPPADGIFDDSIVLVLDPPAGASGDLSIEHATCGVVGGTCVRGPAIAAVGFTHNDTEACLAPDAAELGYGSIAAVEAPCFVGDPAQLDLPLYPGIGLTITLEDAVVAAADTGDGEHYEGLIRGILPADAAAAITVPVVGTLAAAMCPIDLDDGGSGWALYYAFTAERIDIE